MADLSKDHLDHLTDVAQEDVDSIVEKEKAYGSSWKRRGGVGAYMAMIRKVDRMEEISRRYGYDIFAALSDKSAGESMLDTIRDLRRYLNLIESEFRAQQIASEIVRDPSRCQSCGHDKRHHFGVNSDSIYCDIGNCRCAGFTAI